MGEEGDGVVLGIVESARGRWMAMRVPVTQLWLRTVPAMSGTNKYAKLAHRRKVTDVSADQRQHVIHWNTPPMFTPPPR